MPHPGAGRLEVMESLARPVPLAVLAARLGIADAGHAAGLAQVTAAAYFPGAAAEQERAADASAGELVRMLGPADEEAIVAIIAVLVQACDATAALIGKTVCHALPPAGARNMACSTDAIMAEVVRHDPPLRVTRRASGGNAALNGLTLPADELVLLRVDAANRDPELCEDPARFDPDRRQGPTSRSVPACGRAQAKTTRSCWRRALSRQCATAARPSSRLLSTNRP